VYALELSQNGEVSRKGWKGENVDGIDQGRCLVGKSQGLAMTMMMVGDVDEWWEKNGW
jgi:hypothetical protein